jgi:peptidoglycan/LPS O-acetylase OafA/YrhL
MLTVIMTHIPIAGFFGEFRQYSLTALEGFIVGMCLLVLISGFLILDKILPS